MEITIGTNAKIAGKAYRVYNITGDLVCFGRVGKNGKMLSPKPHNLGAHTLSEIEAYAKIGAIEIL